MRWKIVPVLALTWSGCSNAPIEDGAKFGPFTQVKTFFTSAFVAETSQGVVVVDAGFSRSAKPIEAHLEDRGLSLDDVTDVIITHGHSDHVRGLGAFGNARVWAHEAEVALVREESDDGIQVTDTVVDGDVIAVGDLEFEVLHVPGHTAGNLCLLADGVLLTGDTALSFKDGTVGPAPERYSDDPQQAMSELLSLRDRLAERSEDLTAVVFAHSEGMTDVTPFWEMTDGS